MLIDDFLPVYDVSDAVATVVHADVATTWGALMEVDLIDVGRKRPLIGVLGAIRMLPDIVRHVLHGELPQRPPKHLRLRETAKLPSGDGGWVLLGDRAGDEIALGLVGKFWRPVIDFGTVTAERFRDFAEPRVREDDLFAVGASAGQAAHAVVWRYANRYNRRACTPMVPPVLDVWRRFRRPHPCRWSTRCHARDGRSASRQDAIIVLRP